MSDYAFQLDAVGLGTNEHVNLDLLSKTVRDAHELAGFIAKHRYPFYVAHRRVGDAERLLALHGLFTPVVMKSRKWTDLESVLGMPVITLNHFKAAELLAELDKVVAQFPDHAVCFVDVPQAESTFKKINEPTLDEVAQQLAAAIAALDTQAKATIEALVRKEPEAAGWADDTPDLSVVPAAIDPFEAAKQTRDRLLAKESWLDSKAVARAARSTLVESNPAQFASRLRREHRLFGVRWRGEYLHPAFQFLPTGELNPEMAKLLDVLPTTDANWNAAFWLFQPTGKLGGHRPADVFANNPKAVIAAATADFVRDPAEGVVRPGPSMHGG